MKARGILKASSTCQDVAPSELMSMSLRILSGAAGWTVVSEYTTLLQAPASDDMWLSDMGLEKQSCVHLLLIGAADAFRRLILPFESLPWSLFKVINEDDDAAMTSLHTLRMQHRPCDLCWDQLFAAVFIDWVLSDNIPLPKQMRRLRHLKLLLGDVLLQLPTSTVDVERSHANIQVDASNHKAVPKRPANIQADSLITHTVLEHSQVKALVEDASLGDAASRVRRTMRARRIESAAPGRYRAVELSVTKLDVERHMFSKQRLGSLTNRDITAQIAQEWQDMPEDERARFQVEADKMQLARDALAKTALAGSAAEEFVEQEMLSSSQVKRLNQSRVDINLQRVAEHTAWTHGLGLSDHMAALRPDFLPSIATTAAFQQLKAEYDSIFNFDASIVPNEKKTPSFRRPCGTCHGGTCQTDLGFEEVCKLLTKFHSEVLTSRLGANPFLVSLGIFDVTGEVDTDCELSWYIVATATFFREVLMTASDDMSFTFQNMGGRLPAEDPTGDMMACLLSLEAQAELDAARAEVEGQQQPQPRPDADMSGTPRGSQDPLPPPPAPPTVGAFFQRQLGILGVGTVKRGNVRCYHCGLAMPSGTLRFDFAFRYSKPSRSIHTDCLLQIEEDEALQNSIRKLQELLGGEISPSAARACREALATLQRLQRM
eukprot:s1043_g5.t1